MNHQGSSAVQSFTNHLVFVGKALDALAGSSSSSTSALHAWWYVHPEAAYPIPNIFLVPLIRHQREAAKTAANALHVYILLYIYSCISVLYLYRQQLPPALHCIYHRQNCNTEGTLQTICNASQTPPAALGTEKEVVVTVLQLRVYALLRWRVTQWHRHSLRPPNPCTSNCHSPE